jgi:hypothetical protein
VRTKAGVVYDDGVTDDARFIAQMTELLDALRLVEARESIDATTQEQLDALLARIAAVTTALRQHPLGTISVVAERLAARLALADLAASAAALRAMVQASAAGLEQHATAAEAAYSRAAELSDG